MATVVLSGKVRRPNAVHVCAALFLLWSACTLFWTTSLNATMERTLTYAQVVLLAFLIWQHARTPERQNTLFESYVLGAYVPAIDTIRHYIIGTPINASNTTRFSATGFNANEIAIILVLGIPMAWYLALSTKRRAYALINGLYIPVALVAALLTASRGAFVAIPASLLLIPASFPRLSDRAKFGLIAIAVASLVALGLMVPTASWQRVGATAAMISEGDFSDRQLIWRDALDVIRDHPIVGIGAGAFLSQPLGGVAEVREPTHQTFLSVLTGQGFVGLTLFVSMLAVAFSSILRMRGLQRQFWIALGLTLLISLLPRDWDFRKQPWFVLGMLTAQGALVQRAKSRVAAPRHVVAPLQSTPELAR
jgi:O-antigen ligase